MGTDRCPNFTVKTSFWYASLFGEKRPSKIKGFVEVYLNSLFVCASLCLFLITKLSDYFFEQNFVIPNLSGRELPISQGLILLSAITVPGTTFWKQRKVN